MIVKLRKLLNEKIKAGSGVDILMLGLTVTIVVSLISLVQNTRTIMIHRRDMIDANLTLSLLDVDVADKELLGNSNIIAFNGTKSLRQDINTKADKIDLITEFARSMSENFSDTTSHGDLLIKNRSLFFRWYEGRQIKTYLPNYVNCFIRWKYIQYKNEKRSVT